MTAPTKPEAPVVAWQDVYDPSDLYWREPQEAGAETHPLIRLSDHERIVAYLQDQRESLAQAAGECSGGYESMERHVDDLRGQLRERDAEIERLKGDAERYRWLRRCHWDESPLAVVSSPKEAIKLGYDAPSLERLDKAIDAALNTEGAKT